MPAFLRRTRGPSGAESSAHSGESPAHFPPPSEQVTLAPTDAPCHRTAPSARVTCSHAHTLTFAPPSQEALEGRRHPLTPGVRTLTMKQRSPPPPTTSPQRPMSSSTSFLLAQRRRHGDSPAFRRGCHPRRGQADPRHAGATACGPRQWRPGLRPCGPPTRALWATPIWPRPSPPSISKPRGRPVTWPAKPAAAATATPGRTPPDRPRPVSAPRRRCSRRAARGATPRGSPT